MVSPIFQYKPPQNTPSSADITMCARKNVLSLSRPNKSANTIKTESERVKTPHEPS